jgi:hypothetical protein
MGSLSNELRGLCAVALAALLSGGCADHGDREAKARIFSPEEPARPVLAASEPIDVDALGRDPALAQRVLGMSASEAVQRLGPHRLAAQASFQWTIDKQTIALSEKRLVELAAADKFYLRSENDHDNGYEIVRLGEKTFVKPKYHKYRQRDRDRGQSSRLCDEVYGLLKSASSLTGSRLGLVPSGADTVAGRSAQRFMFTLLKAPVAEAGTTKLPPIELAAAGPDKQTRLRLDFASRRTPKTVEGTLWVDRQTGVPLKSELTATIGVPAEDSGAEALLTIKMSHSVDGIGSISVNAPEDFLPDEDRPNGIAATLDRFDVQRPDAGTSEKAESPAADDE